MEQGAGRTGGRLACDTDDHLGGGWVGLPVGVILVGETAHARGGDDPNGDIFPSAAGNLHPVGVAPRLCRAGVAVGG